MGDDVALSNINTALLIIDSYFIHNRKVDFIIYLRREKLMAKKNNGTEYKVFYMLIGILGGISLGVAFGNLAMGMAMGMLLGTTVDCLVYSTKKKQKKD